MRTGTRSTRIQSTNSGWDTHTTANPRWGPVNGLQQVQSLGLQGLLSNLPDIGRLTMFDVRTGNIAVADKGIDKVSP